MKNKYLLCLPICVGLLPLNAYAYLDPGTTGIILASPDWWFCSGDGSFIGDAP